MRLLASLAHQAHEGRQRRQLPFGEQVRPLRHPVLLNPETERPFGEIRIGPPGWPGAKGHLLVFGCGREIDATGLAVGHHCHQAGVHASRLGFRAQVVERHRDTGEQATKRAAASADLRPPLRRFQVRRRADAYFEPVVLALDHRLDPSLLALLGGEQEVGDERGLDIGERRVRTSDGPRPQPGDHGQLPARVARQVGALGRHLVRNPRLRVEMADAPLRLIADPRPVVAHILGEPRRALPVLRGERGFPGLRIHRRTPGELRRDLDHRLVDEHRHRVEVARVGLQAEPLRLERDRPASGERVVERRQPRRVEEFRRARMVGIVRAGPPPTDADLFPRPLDQLLVRRVLPLHQFPQDPEQPLALPVLLLPGREQFRPGRRVVHQLREQYRPRRGQRPPRPPQVQRAGMPVADGLLPRRRLVDGIEGQGHLDEFADGLHGLITQGAS